LKSGAAIRIDDPRVQKLRDVKSQGGHPNVENCESLDADDVSPVAPVLHSAFAPLDRGPPRTMTVSRGDVADKLAAVRSADDIEER
jgi:hypothetical protein